MLAYCEGRRESPWDTGPIDLVVRRSVDGGGNWSEPAVLVEGKGETAHNAVMIAEPGRDEVHLLYGMGYRRCFHARSRDAGATFGPASEITGVFEQYRPEYDWKLIATGPGHGIRLRGGRLLVPVWLSTSPEQKPTMASVIYSDDGGGQWRRGPVVVRDGDGQGIANPMEPVVAELPDRRVMMNVRNASPGQRRAVAISPDGVGGWSPFYFDAALREPFCMGSLCNLPGGPRDGGEALLFANPDNVASSSQPGTVEVGGADRKRLTMRLSADQGRSWPHARVLEPGWSGYSDLAVGPGGAIHCLYESGCVGNLMWDIASIRLATFTRDWLTRG
jgi:sialidase-1